MPETVESEVAVDIIKDDCTVVSEESVDEVAPSIAPKKSRLGMVVFGAIIIIAGIVGLTIFSSKMCSTSTTSNPTSSQDSQGELYELSMTVGPVGTVFYAASDKFGFVDLDTNCVQIMSYNSDDTGAAIPPLCGDFGNIQSLSLHDNRAVIAHDGIIEAYEFFKYADDGDEWQRYPPSRIAGTVVKRERIHTINIIEPGFGKKTALIGNKLYIASDEYVYYYQNYGKLQGWNQKHRWEAHGFDMNEDGTTLVVYTSDKVEVYNLGYSLNKLTAPMTYTFSTPISTVVVDGHNVNVVVESSTTNNSFNIQHLTSGTTTPLDMPATIAGDAIYPDTTTTTSNDSGNLIDIANGNQFQLELENADQVYQVQTCNKHLVVLLQRDGDNVLEVFSS